jgi:hypothetical protein
LALGSFPHRMHGKPLTDATVRARPVGGRSGSSGRGLPSSYPRPMTTRLREGLDSMKASGCSPSPRAAVTEWSRRCSSDAAWAGGRQGRFACVLDRSTDSVPAGEGELEEEQEVGVRSPHHPRIVHRPDGPWVVECRQCREDRSSSVPIGIGLPLADQVTAERLAENHARPGMASSSR